MAANPEPLQLCAEAEPSSELQCSTLSTRPFPNPHALYFPNREIVALVAQVVPIYAVSHLFEGLAVSIMQCSLQHFYDLCVSSDDSKFKGRREAWGGGIFLSYSLDKNAVT